MMTRGTGLVYRRGGLVTPRDVDPALPPVLGLMIVRMDDMLVFVAASFDPYHAGLGGIRRVLCEPGRVSVVEPSSAPTEVLCASLAWRAMSLCALSVKYRERAVARFSSNDFRCFWSMFLVRK